MSVTWNLHGVPLGEAQGKINAALKSITAPPKSSTIVVRGQIPALEETITGLRTGLLLAIAAIFLLLIGSHCARLACTSGTVCAGSSA